MKTRLIWMAAAAGLVLSACGDDGSGIEAQDLRGSWSATIYQLTDDADGQNQVDLIQRDGASFTLTVDAAGVASTVFDDGVGGTSSDSGTLDSTGTTLTLSGTPFTAVRAGDVLTLNDFDASFDFGSGMTAASLLIVMSRN
ncbi:MAG: hypothetical protein ABFS34_02855 [Gemmatimonadota bacterium]